MRFFSSRQHSTHQNLSDSSLFYKCQVIALVFKLGFPTGRDGVTFWDNGTEVSSLSRDKGTTGQAKNLTKGRDGPGQPKFPPDSGGKGIKIRSNIFVINTDKKEKDRKFQTAPLPFKVVFISSCFFLLAIGSPDLSHAAEHTKEITTIFTKNDNF